MSGKHQRNRRFVFQPLTCIRQTGISRQPDGSVIYTFAAQVSKDLAPVMMTLLITERRDIRIQARFLEAEEVQA